jgi:hypothetical protein
MKAILNSDGLLVLQALSKKPGSRLREPKTKPSFIIDY